MWRAFAGVGLLLGWVWTVEPAVAQPAMFPFNLDWEGPQGGITDLSILNEKPAGAKGFVSVGPDGHLYAGGRRIRFFGVNFTWQACTPEKEDAEKIARRLAAFGINAVRFHMLDADWGTKLIFDPAKPGTRSLNPAALDRLDYFVAQLIQQGIYINFNLLTARRFSAADGVDPAIDTIDWKRRQTPALFDPVMIELQKEYATQLLTHVNPYTGRSYLEEPAVAFVEILNEHGLIQAWHDHWLDDLPNVFSEELRVRWNDFLAARYASHEALEEVWTVSTPIGEQLLRNGDFSKGLANWNLEQHQGAAGILQVVGGGPAGKPAVRLQATALGKEIWHLQFNQNQLHISTGLVYTLRFWARADRPTEVNVVIEQAHEPWKNLGFDRPLELTPEWRRFEFAFMPAEGDDNARLNIRGLGDELATYWFADFSLQEGGRMGLLAGEDLGRRTIQLVKRDSVDLRTSRALRDWIDFLWETERSYWLTMRAHLKETLGSRALIVGTVVGTSTPHLMALFDVVDSHAYWQHPSFEKAWDFSSGWWIRNSSMVGDTGGGTVTGLAMKRVYGKPFMVSEYNHPFPNTFAAEGFPMLALFGALQDWDAVFAYTYSDGKLSWSLDRQEGFFDLHRDPVKMISLWHAALLFRRGEFEPWPEWVLASLPEETEKELLVNAPPWRLVDAQDAGMPPPAAMLYRTGLWTGPGAPPQGTLQPSDAQLPGDGRYVGENGSLLWDTRRRILQADSPNAKLLVGYVVGRSFELGEFVVRPVNSLQGWAAFYLIRPPSGEVGVRRYLLSALGLSRNHDQQWLFYPSKAPAGFPPPADVNLTLGSWGVAPVEIEGVSAEIELPWPPGKVRVWALGPRGERVRELEVAGRSGGSLLRISAELRAPWYEIEVTQGLTVQGILPGFGMGLDGFWGAAVANPGSGDEAVRLVFHGEAGSEDRAMTLAEGEQTAGLANEWFHDSASSAAWLELLGSSSELVSFALFGKPDLSCMDGIPAVTPREGPLYLTRVVEGRGTYRGHDAVTHLVVVNAGPESAAVELVLRELTAGWAGPSSELARRVVGLEPRAAVGGTLAEIFGPREVGTGMVEIRGEAGALLAAMALTEVSGTGACWSEVAVAEGAGPLLVSPQMVSLPEMFSSLRLWNVSDQLQTVTIHARDPSGEDLAPPVSVELPSRGGIAAEVETLFLGLDRTVADWVGYLTVEGPGAGQVVGDVLFGTRDGRSAALVRLNRSAARRLVFGHVASQPGRFFTGLAFVNPGSAPADGELRFCRPSGEVVGTAELHLEPGERAAGLVHEWNPAAADLFGGYVEVTGTLPLVADELFGTYDLNLLASVPARGFP
ncbi:MAG: hypothetical protein Kow00109_05660 [Acidobacteriota bacterium]